MAKTSEILKHLLTLAKTDYGIADVDSQGICESCHNYDKDTQSWDDECSKCVFYSRDNQEKLEETIKQLEVMELLDG